MTRPDLEHLRTFLTVVRTGSVSEAARLIGISQSTATAHIRALEELTQATLFERTPSGMHPTPRARALATDVAPHVDALDDLLYLAQPSRGTRIGGPAEFLSIAVIPHVARITKDASVEFTFGVVDSLIDSLREGELDVVISATRPHGPGLSVSPLFEEEFELVGAPGTDLNQPLIAYSPDLPIIRRYWRTVFGMRPTDLQTTAIIPDLRGILDAVFSSAGMSVLPTYLCAQALQDGTLTRLHVPDKRPTNTVYLVTKSADADKRDIRAVVKVLRELAAALA